jgi:hypothetical protein
VVALRHLWMIARISVSKHAEAVEEKGQRVPRIMIWAQPFRYFVHSIQVFAILCSLSLTRRLIPCHCYRKCATDAKPILVSYSTQCKPLQDD